MGVDSDRWFRGGRQPGTCSETRPSVRIPGTSRGKGHGWELRSVCEMKRKEQRRKQERESASHSSDGR